jgi:hypothetical protein
MNNQEKALLYDNLLFESDKLQRINSKLKSEYAGNIPEHIQTQIDGNNHKIALLVRRLEDLLR